MRTVGIVFGPTVWAAHFFAMYGAATAVCRDPSLVSSVSLAFAAAGLTLVALLALLAGAVRSLRYRGGSPTLAFVAFTLMGLSALAIVWTAAPVAAFPDCMPAKGL